MSRLDLVRLRKSAGMSQRELAGQLQVRPSFLSAIENGRSRLPEEKLERIKEIFEIEDLEDYFVEDSSDIVVPPHTHVAPHSHITHSHLSEQSDSITQLLNHFHDLAHQREKSCRSEEGDLMARNDFLTKRNDRLSEKVDDLRDEVDKLRKENMHLKELLIKNGIEY